MARYIDADRLYADVWVFDNERSIRKMIDETPTEDVIERSKVHKAIEEMRCYLKTTPNNEEFIDGIEHSIEILKRNIGA